MKKWIILCVMLWAGNCFGATCGAGPFYVSSSIGNDTNNGTSASTPWAHHPWDANKTGNANCTLAGDNIVYMMKGDVWWDCSLFTAQSGTSGHQITTTSTDTFGSGANPLCSGSYDTTGYDSGWTQVGATTVWWRSPGATAPNIVVYNGTILVKDSSSSVAANKWFFSAADIGEGTNILYVNVGGDPSSATAWRVGKRDQPLNVTNNDYITIKDVDFEVANSTGNGGAYIGARTGVVFDGITFTYGGSSGGLFNPRGAINFEIKNCTGSKSVRNNGVNYPIMMLHSINGGSVHDNALTGGGWGIVTNTTATSPALIYNNTISGQYFSGGTRSYGIQIAHGTGWQIYNNTIHTLGMSGSNTQTTGISIETASNAVYDNTIYDIGDWGYTGTNYGIYVSADSNNIYDNLIYNIRYSGVYLFDADLNNIYGNELHDCGYKTTNGADWYYYGANGGGEAINIQGTSENNKAYRNNCYNNYSGIGINVSSGAGNNIASYNLINGVIVNGIGISQDGAPATPNAFYNNTIIHTPSANNTPAYRGHGMYMQNSTDGGGNAIFANNIIYQMSPYTANTEGLWISDGGVLGPDLTSLKIDNNLIYCINSDANLAHIQLLGTDYTYTQAANYKAAMPTLSAKITGLDGVQANAESNSVSSDPLFISTSDYRLRSTSPAINAGAFITGVHDQPGVTDYAGQDLYNMPGVDIGAYGTVKSTMILKGGTLR